MPTPIYNGAGQSIADNGVGLLGALGSIFGGGAAPAYAGDGQPSGSVSGGLLGGGTPAYAAAPTTQQAAMDGGDSSLMETQAVTECLPLNADALAQGLVAIVVPRSQP